MSTTEAVDTSALNLSDPELWTGGRERVLATFAELRAKQPVSKHPAPVTWAPERWAPGPYWAVTRHADIAAVSRDTSTFSNAQGIGFALDGVPRSHYIDAEGFLAMDPPRHRHLRRLVASAFTPRMMKKVDGFIQEQAELAIDNIAERGECDFHHDLAAPFPLGVICDMLGVPREDHAWVAETVDLVDEEQVGSPELFAESLVESCKIMASYGSEIARKRRADPQEDLVSALVVAEVDGERLNDEQIGSIFNQLILAGTETTAGTTAYAMHAMSLFPEQRSRLQADYDGLADSAIEEMLRWATVIPAFRRTVMVDTELGGQQLAAGDALALFYLSANFDETVFADPNSFDLSRNDRNHFSFGGGGIHFCLGNALARTEMKIFFKELFQRLPDIEIDGEVVQLATPSVSAFVSLPCTYTPKRAAR